MLAKSSGGPYILTWPTLHPGACAYPPHPPSWQEVPEPGFRGWLYMPGAPGAVLARSRGLLASSPAPVPNFAKRRAFCRFELAERRAGAQFSTSENCYFQKCTCARREIFNDGADDGDDGAAKLALAVSAVCGYRWERKVTPPDSITYHV